MDAEDGRYLPGRLWVVLSLDDTNQWLRVCLLVPSSMMGCNVILNRC